jgi:dCTP deaminase
MAIATYLADSDILALAAEEAPIVTPFNAKFVRSASVDLHLSEERYDYNFERYRAGDRIEDSQVTRTKFETVELKPHETVHFALSEAIHIPSDCLGWVFARSSFTRIGLRIAPVFMNPGYSGTLPITITNAASFCVTLSKNQRVAQLVCARLAVRPTRDYVQSEGKYINEHAAHSLLHTDEEIKSALNRVLGNYLSPKTVQAIL